LKILFHNFYNSLNKNNYLFNELNTSIGDNLLAPFHELLRQSKSRNIIVGTSDVMKIADADALVFLDYPDSSNSMVQSMFRAQIPKYLVVFESPLVRQLPPKDELLSKFDRIFTYDDSLVDEDRILKINYSFKFPKLIVPQTRNSKKLLTLIAGNKKDRSFNELYSKRLEAINWFDKNASNEFDFYGIGWNYFDFGPRLPLRIFNRFHLIRTILAPRFRTYRGPIVRKNPILRKYQFAICYENVANVPGYITEKIFDCFLAGCVPIYWGASNVSMHIPKNCYIDKLEFNSYEDLYRHIKGMDDAEYNQYIANINEFIYGEKGALFSSEKFSETVLNSIVLDLVNKKH
jgi:alpha(1,3/1,4) fucosyltransferase